MSRLRQYFANRYSSSEATNSEFENIVRYINSAELGNNTLAELLEKIFDDAGDVDLSLSMRYDAATGIEYKLGESEDDPWNLVVDADDIRGAAGINVGTVESPIMFNRVDYVATAAQTTFSYTFSDAAADVLVFVNGLLQPITAYTKNVALNQVIFGAGLVVNDKVTVYSIRNNAAASWRRTDFTATTNQSLFPFAHTADEEIIVYRNGVLQRVGAAYDFITSSATGTITMTTAQPNNTLISVLVVDNTALRTVLGLMLEDEYTTNGLINLAKISIADGAIPQVKVASLVAALAAKAPIYVQNTTPVAPVSGTLWVNTSLPIPALYFYDGTRWLSSSPDGLIPLPTVSDALKFLKLNSTATALEFANIDLSSVMPYTILGGANGVAPLSGAAVVPNAYLPDGALRAPMTGRVTGAITNGTYIIGMLYGAQFQLDKVAMALSAGTATAQLTVNAVNVGSTFALSTTAAVNTWTAEIKNATSAGLAVAVVITGAAGASDITWSLPAKLVA